MSEPASRPRPHRSVFVRLVVIVLGMSIAVMLMLTGFFYWLVFPQVHASINELFGEYTRAVAASRPDLETARRIGAALDMEVRYEGPGGAWTTDEDLPSIAAAQARLRAGHPSHLLRLYDVVPAPQGGDYLFARRLRGQFHVVQHNMFVLLLTLIAGVFATTYLVLRRTLRPLRLLDEGVARLGAGQLDVVVPSTTRDEFGALTEAFNRMARRVQDRVRARDQLLLDVSHELRSPLTRMKVALALLPDSSNRASMAADVAEMETLVTELLELERLREGRGLSRERRDLAPILREMAATFHARPPGVRIAGSLPAMVLEIDADKVRTVFRNLLENAIQYSLPDSRPVEIAATRSPEGFEVRVSDDGSGLPAGDPEMLFEPFYRPDRSRSKETGGYGLGLSICKRIMEAHGGSIGAEPGSGRGATFVVRFPLAARS